MNFDQLVNTLYGKRAGNVKIKLGLERIKKLVEAIGNPHKNFKVIHVAGTNGKGSITKALAAIFTGQGIKTGSFISPHLVSITERMNINNTQISREEFIKIYEEIEPTIQDLKESDPEMEPSFFEIITAMALKYFEKNKVELAILEVGLGGRLDSTNVVDSDISIISTIQKDHIKILGDTLEAIAGEKAGIIKKDNIVVLGDIPESPKKVIKEKVNAMNALKIYEYDKDFKFSKTRYSMNWNMINYSGIEKTFNDLVFKSNGSYQPHNLSVALAAAEAYCEKNHIELDEEKLREALKNYSWEGRFELIEHKNKRIILEGAHNADGVKMLKKTVSLYTPFSRKIALIGILDDKDIKEMVEEIPSIFEKIIVTSVPSHRSVNPKNVREELQKHSKTVIEYIENTEKAFNQFLKESYDYYFVTGSLYLVGYIKGLLLEKRDDKNA
jgi:dihydrofolate synthase/folylpolyglutamate synthase